MEAFFVPRRRFPIFVGHDGDWSNGYSIQQERGCGYGPWEDHMLQDEDFSFFHHKCPREMWAGQYGHWNEGHRGHNCHYKHRGYGPHHQDKPAMFGFPFSGKANPAALLAFHIPTYADTCTTKTNCEKDDAKTNTQADHNEKMKCGKRSTCEPSSDDFHKTDGTCEKTVHVEKASVTSPCTWKRRLSIGYFKPEDIKVRVKDSVVYVDGTKEIAHHGMIQYLVMKKKVTVPHDVNTEALRVFFEDGGSLYIEAPAVSQGKLSAESMEKLSLDDVVKDVMNVYQPVSPLPETPQMETRQINDNNQKAHDENGEAEDKNSSVEEVSCGFDETMDTTQMLIKSDAEGEDGSIVVLDGISNDSQVCHDTLSDVDPTMSMDNVKSKEVAASSSESIHKHDNEDKNCEWEMVTTDDTRCVVEQTENAGDVSDSDSPDNSIQSISPFLKDITIRHHTLHCHDELKPQNNAKVIIRPAPHTIIQNDDGSKTFQLSLNVEGYDGEDIDIKTVGDKLTIHAKHIEEEDEGFINHREMYRSFHLPEGTDGDNIECHLATNGTLSIISPVQ